MTWISQFFESIFPVEESDRLDLQCDLLPMIGSRRIHRECRQTLDGLLTSMSGDALLAELSEAQEFNSPTSSFSVDSASAKAYYDKNPTAFLMPESFSIHGKPSQMR